MFGGPKIKLDKELFDRVTRIAKLSGYATADEFVVHVLEKELAALEDAGSDDEIKKKLEGLGYIS
jgi:hypothetical protein